MSKKKVAKFGLTAAAAVTTVVAANPAGAAAASSVEQAVVQAEVSAKALTNFYGNTELTVTPEFEAAYNTAKKAIANAKALVASTTANKAALEARVANAENLQTYAARYIDAVKIVAGELADATAPVADFVDAEEALDADVVENYHALSAAIKKAERTIGKVRGEAVREAFQEGFLLDAKLSREAIIFEVSQFELLEKVGKDIEAGNLENVEADMAKLERLKERAVKIKEDGRELYPDRTDVYPDVPAVEEALRATETAVTEAYEELLTPAVESVSAINVNKLQVTFSGKAFDTTKAKFEVKRGSVTEDVKVTWNEAKTEATLEKTGNFIAGDYTVTVSGVEGLEKASNTVKVEAEKIEEVKITNSALQDSATAPLAVEFINQYGEKATIAANDSKLTVTAFNKTKGSALPNFGGLKFELNALGAELKDEVVVTVMYNGVTTTKTLNVVAPASVGSVSLGEVVLPTGKDKLTPSGTTNVELKYTATNTLGETYKLKTADKTNGAVQFLSSDNAILDAADVTIDSEGKIKIAKFKKAGTVTLTAFSPATGATSKVSIEVKADAGKPETATLEKSAVTFAAGTTTAQYVAVTVKDNYGTVIATKDLKADDYVISTDNNTVANGSLILTGENAGKIAITPVSGATKGQSATITVLVKSTGQKATITATASDAATPSSVEVEKDFVMPTNLLTSATADLKFDVKDQYGTIYSSAAGLSAYTVEYTTSDATVLSIISDESPVDAVDSPVVTVKALKEGSATVKAVLKKDGVAIAEKVSTINVVKNDSSKVTYGVSNFGPLFKDSLGNANTDAALTGVDTAAEAKANGYYASFDVTATDANGAVSIVPASSIVGTPEVVALETASGVDLQTTDVNVFNDGGKWYIGADVETTDFDTDANGNVKDIKAKLRFTISNAGAAQVVEKEFTISKDGLKATEMKVVKDSDLTDNAGSVVAIDAANPTKLDADAVAVSTIEVADFTALEAVANTVVVVKDQFGKYVLANTDSTSAYDNVTVANANLTGFADQGTTSATAVTSGVLTFSDFADDLVFNANQSFQAILKHASLSPVTVSVATKATVLAADADAAGVAKKDADEFTATVTTANIPTGTTQFKVFSRATGAYTVADLENTLDVTGATAIAAGPATVTTLDVTASVASGYNEVLVVYYDVNGEVVGFTSTNTNLQ
ncbi:hypothetical protein ACEWK1_11155 [Metabacillus sp. YM-086]|uniref:hypothetical protein n=1 Tax=Metabacillus sp. YM-086 TaxID=3341729 RepID=UPI003A83F7C6